MYPPFLGHREKEYVGMEEPVPELASALPPGHLPSLPNPASLEKANHYVARQP